MVLAQSAFYTGRQGAPWSRCAMRTRASLRTGTTYSSPDSFGDAGYAQHRSSVGGAAHGRWRCIRSIAWARPVKIVWLIWVTCVKMHVLATRKPIGVLRKAFDADIIAMSREASVSVPKRQPVTQGGHVYEWNIEWQRVLSPSLVIVLASR